MGSVSTSSQNFAMKDHNAYITNKRFSISLCQQIVYLESVPEVKYQVLHKCCSCRKGQIRKTCKRISGINIGKYYQHSVLEKET